VNLLRKSKKLKKSSFFLGADPKGCDECEHKPTLVRKIRAVSWNEAIDKYLVEFPEFAAKPEWFIITMSVKD
jgi:hypothetical protein